MRPLLPVLIALVVSGCGKDPIDRAAPLREVPASASWTVPVRSEAHVLFTEAGVPHVYAADRHDLAVAWGFVVARDRYFMMDLSRRLALGTLSEVLGRDALSADQESRAEGNRHIAEKMLGMIEAHHPDLVDVLDGYADGINAYVDAVKAGTAPAPSEYTLAAGTLGVTDPADLLTPFTRLDVVAGAATVLAQSGFEGGDIGRGRSVGGLDTHFAGYDHAELRQAGLRPDLWDRVEPAFDVASAPDWDPAAGPQPAPPPTSEGQGLGVPSAPLDRILERRDRWDHLRGHDWQSGWGSNTWAMHAEATADGRALLAGDGHLALTIPSLFYQIGLDTALLADDDAADPLTFMGMAVPGVPVPGPGTNGHIAWSQIAFFGDLTDWYREEITLDGSGAPKASRFQGSDRDLIAVSETYTVRDVPVLGSEGGTETWTRWTTFDGRWLADIEGDVVDADFVPGTGQTVVLMGADRVVPRDVDGDGVIEGISFDYAPLDGSGALPGLWAMSEAKDVQDFHQATRDLVGNAAGLVAADSTGSILYTGMEAVPCRTYLDRDDAGRWAQGADPSLLIDGTRYPGFQVPFKDGHVDYSRTSEPTACLVPFEAYPYSIDPAQGFLVAANNDPGGQTLDGDLLNDGYYIGGPWLEGYRADTISRELSALAADKAGSIDEMVRVQGDHTSRLCEQLVPHYLLALDAAKAADPADPGAGGRMATLWSENSERLAEAGERLAAWYDAGCQARSGVETFYNPVLPGDAEDSVATMIFNASYGRFLSAVLDDERLPGGTFNPTGDSGRQRFMRLHFLEGRGAGNPRGLASFNPETGESIYFDINGTPEVETSTELLVASLIDGLDFLTGPGDGPGQGGFNTGDMDAWRWGLRHWVRFDSVLADFLGDDPAFAALTEPFSINPKRFPVASDVTPADPRRNLPGFPRHGDHLNVDAGNPGTSARRFSYGSGPVFRLVVALGPDGPEGVNVLPGGQSGLTDSPHFDDQARLWLGNETLPLRYTVEQVLEGAQAREVFLPVDVD